MSRAEANKLYTNFTKGLITEASPLAYPDNATIDEDNCHITNTGDRTRRYGLNSNDQTTDFTPRSLGVPADTTAVYSHIWKNVNNDSATDFLVYFVKGVVYFEQISTNGALSFYETKAFNVDLSAYKISTATAAEVDAEHVDFASGKGVLFIANKYIDPLRVTYDPDLDAINVTVITIKVRDHYGIEDDLAVDEEPPTLTARHHYNLLNQGWEYSGGGLTTPTGATGSGPGGTVAPTDPTTPDSWITGGATGFPIPGYNPGDPTISVPDVPPPLDTGYVERLGGTVVDANRTYSFPVYDETYTFPTTNGPIYKYFSRVGFYPSNAKVWWAGKNAEGDFDAELLQKTFFGNTRAPRGHFVINAFTKDRSAVSGIASIETDAINTRPEAICFASGRIFYGANSTVYMSPVLENTDRAGQCYQEADPTSEDISDLIPTDGGFIEVPDADFILSLKPLADGIVILATNGVWFLNSGGQGFTAVDYSLSRISDIGVSARESAVLAGDALYWWTRQGIQAIAPATGQFGAIPGQFSQQNITEQTIKTFYSGVNEFTRDKTKGVYDPASNKIIWLYRKDNTHKRYFLVYDLKYQAFVPMSVDCEHLIVADLFVDLYYCKNTIEDTFIKFLCLEQRWVAGGTNDYRHYLVTGQFLDPNFVDGQYAVTNHQTPTPESYDLMVVSTYESFIETGYEVMQDGLRKKQVPFLGVFFKYRNGDAACSMTTKWSWANAESSNKWSTPVYAYRPQKNYWRTEEENLTNMEKYDIIYTRNKVRGSGRALQIRFSEARAGYGFTIVGWHAFFQGNIVP